MSETRVVYFDKPGPGNTEAVLRLAKQRADTLGIADIVVASYSGSTGVLAAKVFSGSNLVVVAGVYGFEEANRVAMTPENRSRLEETGARILHTGHPFGMMGRAVKNKFGAIQVDEIIANVLRLFGQGVKVGCEITCMAADAGLIKAGAETIAIAGSARGADSAIVIRASNTHNFFDSRILEIICKPRG